jgi:predicted nucleotidyltransferase component of viral defense system
MNRSVDLGITQALRVIPTASGDKDIIKGGTSLVKGWNAVQRFSEDIDIFLNPTAFQPPLGKRGIDRELKKLSDVSKGIRHCRLRRMRAKQSEVSVEPTVFPTMRASLLFVIKTRF